MGGFGTQIPYWSMNYAAATTQQDAFTTLLLHFDDIYLGGRIQDYSIYGNTASIVIGATISTFGKFGGALTQSSSSVTSINPPSVQVSGRLWELGTASFTIDWWSYMPSTSVDATNSPKVIAGYCRKTADNTFGAIGASYPTTTANAAVLFGYLNLSSWVTNQYYYGITVSTNEWHHYAIVRKDPGTTVNDWSAYVDGKPLNTKTLGAGSWNANLTTFATASVRMGTALYNYMQNHNGLIDEFRISKGIARYDGTFSPPTSPY